jgi:hypothetical protein
LAAFASDLVAHQPDLLAAAQQAPRLRKVRRLFESMAVAREDVAKGLGPAGGPRHLSPARVGDAGSPDAQGDNPGTQAGPVPAPADVTDISGYGFKLARGESVIK